ncbi:hypothetical protein SNE40_022084 [Patella caerulea]|uniref:Uncharacterized protein n=1 Tax=Patella caerulea TaxID=87958 RepID=A0AAN8IXH9_PATCE
MLCGHQSNVSFCSIFASMRHDPVTIWAHLVLVLEKLAPTTTDSKLHFVSDGQTMQYRNKLNFYLTSKYPFKFGYKHVTLNLLEAGHGKWAVDRARGKIKRAADRLVSLNNPEMVI